MQNSKSWTVENSDFELDFYSRTTSGVYKTGHDSIRLTKWFA